MGVSLGSITLGALEKLDPNDPIIDRSKLYGRGARSEYRSKHRPASPGTALATIGARHPRYCQNNSLHRSWVRKYSATSHVEPRTQQPPNPPGPLPARLPRRTAATSHLTSPTSVLIPRWHCRFGLKHPPRPLRTRPADDRHHPGQREGAIKSSPRRF